MTKQITWNNLPDNDKQLLRLRLGDAAVDDLKKTKAGGCDLLLAVSYTLFGANKLFPNSFAYPMIKSYFPEIWPPLKEYEYTMSTGMEKDFDEKEPKPEQYVAEELLPREKQLLEYLAKAGMRHVVAVLLGDEKPLPAKSSLMKMFMKLEKAFGADSLYVAYLKKWGEQLTEGAAEAFKNYIKK